jgi:hypothetical protein
MIQSMQRISLMYSHFDVFLIIFCNKIGLWLLNKGGSCLHVLQILKKWHHKECVSSGTDEQHNMKL